MISFPEINIHAVHGKCSIHITLWEKLLKRKRMKLYYLEDRNLQLECDRKKMHQKVEDVLILKLDSVVI